MLTFSLYSDDQYTASQKVHINAAAVASVEETQRRPMDRGWQDVAVIHLTTGEKHVVYDGARTVAKEIAEAQS